MPESNSIEISFLGGASSIGASCTMIKVAGATFVVDCGVRYSGASPLPDLSMLADTQVDAILVTHAHMDHSGGLPVLAEACPGAPVFATPPSIDLIGILLRDSLRLMNSPDRESEVPLYTENQVEQLLRRMAPVRHHQPIQVGEIEIVWLPASHILGASMIVLKTPAGTVLFTGDYSVTAQHTVPALSRPDFLADIVISEATYGERLHEDRNAAELRLVNQVSEVINREGRILIPAFAVGRAQEVLSILKRARRNGTLPEAPVFVDGMVRAVCDVYRSHETFVSRSLLHEIRRTPHAFYTDSIQPVARQDRTRVLDTTPCVVVSSSGMLTGGPSQGYCQEFVKNANDAILLTGYQDEESPGRALLNLARSEGAKELRIGQTRVPVNCFFGTYGLSAHADRMQMVSLIEATTPRTVLLVHGDESAKESLARSLQCGDVICAQDGLTIQRSYKPRTKRYRRPAATVPVKEQLDVNRARNLLGPPGSAPLRAAEVAEAWFGGEVDRTTVEQFARVLESAGLVRRDDQKRDRLWVLGVQETDIFPDEAALESELKQENPKGQVLEFCMRMHIEPPIVEMEQRGAFFEATMQLRTEEQTLSSGVCQAASKKTAEQMAASKLLELVRSQEIIDDEAVAVDNDAVARLQSNNPKGKLLEWCARHKIPTPHFEQRTSPEGYRVRGKLSGAVEAEIVTPWYESPKLKLGEQAASEWIFEQLPGEPQTLGPAGEPFATPDHAPQRQETANERTGRNAAMALNELCQAGILQTHGFEEADSFGPSHQPTFAVIAWADTPDGQMFRTDPIQGPSKKAARRSAADRLLDLLIQHGLTR